MVSFLLAFSFVPVPGAGERPSYLFRADFGSDQKPHMRGDRYQPRPGDILLFDDHNKFMAKVYSCCGTGGPLHAGVVFRRNDGTFAILEAGTNAGMKVFVFDLEPRLHHFDGTILVRRLRQPLNDEQSRHLADFALAQEGKWYAFGRLALQATPLRPRNAPLAQYFGRTVLDRDRWICSELVVASLATASVWDVDTFPANLMYPRDLCYDERFDLSPYYETPAMWYPRPELDFVGKGVRVGIRD